MSQPNYEPLSYELDLKRDELMNRQHALLASFSKAATAIKHPRRLGELYLKIRQTNEFLEALDTIKQSAAEKARTARHFTVSSVLLQEASRKLTADRDEQFVFVTGVELTGTFVLTQMLDLHHLRRHVAGVTADPKCTHEVLIRLELAGHRLLAHFHSHPGNGPGSTFPSGIDEAFQERLERAGHLAIMAIFSRDGFVRFLRLDNNYTLSVFGDGLERIEPNVYRIKHFS